MLKEIDNLVLMSLHAWRGRIASQSSLAEELRVSTAGLSRSLDRLDFARLIHRPDLTIVKPHVEEYLAHSLRYVFPVRLGTKVRGVPTAHSAPPLRDEIASQETYVWSADFGKTSGLEVIPLHENVPALSIAYPSLYPVFAVLDAIRIGRSRERRLAVRYLKEWLSND